MGLPGALVIETHSCWKRRDFALNAVILSFQSQADVNSGVTTG